MDFERAVEAVQNGEPCLDELTRALAEEKGEDDTTLLHWAAYNNRCRIARKLIELGADVNLVGGKVGETPLMWAMRRKFYAMCAILVESGADVHAVSKTGCDLVHNCVKLQTDTEGDLMGLFLALQWGVNTDHRDDNGDTAMTWLAKNRKGDPSHDLMRLLMRYHDEDGEAMSYQKQQEARTDGNSLLHLLSLKSMNSLGYKPRYTDLNIAMDIHQHEEVRFWHSVNATTKQNREGETPYELAGSNKHSYMNFFLIDALQYNMVPKWAPLASGTFLVLFTAFLLSYSGLLWGALFISLTVPFTAKFTLQWNIPKQNYLAYAGLVIGFFLLMIILMRDYEASFFSSSIFWLMVVTTAVLSVRLAHTDPVTLPPGDREELARGIIAGSLQEGPRMLNADGEVDEEALATGSVYTGPVLCATCICDKRYATNHCNLCGRCVCGQDAHIPHLGVCAGQGNRRLFTVVLACMSLTFAVFAMVAFSHHSTELCPDMGYWFVFHWIAVELCVLLEHPTQVSAVVIAFGLAGYMLIILYTDLLFVGKELTLNLAANHLITSIPNISVEVVSRNLRKFFREGTYGISLGDARVEYAPPVRRKIEAREIEVPIWLRNTSARLGASSSDTICKTYTQVAAFVGEFSGSKQVPPLFDVNSEASEFDEDSSFLVPSLGALDAEESQPLKSARADREVRLHGEVTARLEVMARSRARQMRAQAEARRQQHDGEEGHSHSHSHSHSHGGGEPCCENHAAPARPTGTAVPVNSEIMNASER